MSSQTGADGSGIPGAAGAKQPGTGRSIPLASGTNYVSVVTDEVEDEENESASPSESFDPNQPVPGVFIAPAPSEPLRPAVSHTTYPQCPPQPPENPLNPSEALPPGCEGLFCVNPTCPCDPSRRAE